MWAVSNRGQTVQPYPKRRTAQTGRGVGRNIWQAIHYIYWDRAYQSAWIADDLPECYGYITRVANLLQTENCSDMMRLEQMRNRSWLPGTDTGMASHGMCTV